MTGVYPCLIEVTCATSYSFPVYGTQRKLCPVGKWMFKKFHRLCAVYIWDSRFERMRRSNLFLCPFKGGFALVNLKFKLLVQRFMLFRNSQTPALEYALNRLGGKYLDTWMVSSTQAAKHSSFLRYYKEIRGAVKFF